MSIVPSNHVRERLEVTAMATISAASRPQELSEVQGELGGGARAWKACDGCKRIDLDTPEGGG